MCSTGADTVRISDEPAERQEFGHSFRLTRRSSNTTYRSRRCSVIRRTTPLAQSLLVDAAGLFPRACRAGNGVDRSGELGYDLPLTSDGAWRSLVARTVRDRKVGGSNPLAPTSFLPAPSRRRNAGSIKAHSSVRKGSGRRFSLFCSRRRDASGSDRKRLQSAGFARWRSSWKGTRERIVEFIKEVQRGPSLARVDRLEIDDLPGGGSHSAFQLEGW